MPSTSMYTDAIHGAVSTSRRASRNIPMAVIVVPAIGKAR